MNTNTLATNTATVPSPNKELAYRLKPEELLLLDGSGNTPLHLAAAHRTPHREKEKWEVEDQITSIDECLDKYHLGLSYVLTKLRDEYPSVELEARDGYDGFNSNIVDVLTTACPDAAKLRNANGDLALHSAIRARKGLKVIQSILKAYPEATRELDSAGKTCLHLLAQQSPGTVNMKETIAKYLEEHGKVAAAATFTTNVEELIVRAMVELSVEENVQSRREIYKRFLYITQEIADWLECFLKSLEKLVANGKLVELENHMYTLSDEFRAEKDNELEAAVKDLFRGGHLVSPQKIELINLITQSYPEARKIRDHQGKLPVQYFIQNRAQNHFDNVALFMDEEVAMMADEGTGLYPFMSAAAIDDIDLSFSLLRAFPSVMGLFVGVEEVTE